MKSNEELITDQLMFHSVLYCRPLLFWNRLHFLSQSPAVDVVGVGTATGRIIIHNIRLDETLMSFTQDWGPVCSLSFRTGMSLPLPLTWLATPLLTWLTTPPLLS